MAPNFQTARERQKTDLAEHAGTSLKYNNLLFSVSEPPQTGISAPTSTVERTHVGFYYLKSSRSVKMDRKRGTLLQFVGSVLTSICGGTQYDALKCERVSISWGETSAARARERPRRVRVFGAPRLDWQAALTPW